MRPTSVLPFILCSFALPALAQSSVTVYGLVDVGVLKFKGGPGGVNAGSQRTTRVDSGGMTTSRWGVRGTEDFGQKASVGFELSGFIRVDSGQTGRGDAIGNLAADPFWSREASLHVSHPRWGTIRVGNFSTPMFALALGNNAFLSSTVFSPLNVVTFIGSPLSGGTGWTDQISYESPSSDGFNLIASTSLPEGSGGRNSAAALVYGDDQLKVSLSWQSVRKDPRTFADGTTSNDTKAWQALLSYDLRYMKLYVNAGSIQNDGTSKAPIDARYSIYGLGASVPVMRGNILLAYASRRTADSVSAVSATAVGGNKARQVLSLGYDHFLSKRTDLYAVVMRDSTSTVTSGVKDRSVSASGTNFGIGMRHIF